MHAAVVVVVLEIGAEHALDAPLYPGLRHGHVEFGGRADRGGESQFGRVGAGGDVVVKVDAVEELGGVEALARHRLAEAERVVANREVGGEADAAKDRGEQRREDREALAQLEPGVQRRQMPAHERGVAAEQEFEELLAGARDDREGERTLGDVAVGLRHAGVGFSGSR